jgi:hypothetical protein
MKRKIVWAMLLVALSLLLVAGSIGCSPTGSGCKIRNTTNLAEKYGESHGDCPTQCDECTGECWCVTVSP